MSVSSRAYHLCNMIPCFTATAVTLQSKSLKSNNSEFSEFIPGAVDWPVSAAHRNLSSVLPTVTQDTRDA